MRLVSFSSNATPGYGILQGETVDVLGWGFGIRDVLALNAAALTAQPVLEQVPLADLRLLPPVPDAGKIICVATNFHEPARQDLAPPSHPLVFTRYADSLVAGGEDLLCPPETAAFDYEGELAVVIGTAGHRISRAQALSHVAGYACFNDGSVRDWQKHSSQFTPGKNFWRSGSFGPWLVTADEIPDLAALELTTKVNGVIKQQISLGRMIFDPAWLISYISTFTPLAPGDVIAAGTPSGFGATRRPPEFLTIGDLVEVQISQIGTLSNRVAMG